MESLPAVVAAGENGEAGAGDVQPTNQFKKEKEVNFFDFHNDQDTDIWGSRFTMTLRKTRSVTLIWGSGNTS